jgi:hypothetical protein
MDLWVTPAMHWSSKNGLGAMWSAFGQLRSLRRHSVWRTGIVISRPRDEVVVLEATAERKSDPVAALAPRKD